MYSLQGTFLVIAIDYYFVSLSRIFFDWENSKLTLDYCLGCSSFNINLFCVVLPKYPWVFSQTRKWVARFRRFGSLGLSLLKLIIFKINCVPTYIHVPQGSSKFTLHVKKWNRFLLLMSMLPLFHSFVSQVLPFHWISPFPSWTRFMKFYASSEVNF